MNALHTIHVAIETLLRNKVRSFLTLLGVMIGVFAVIAMVAAGDGAKARVQQLFASMGSNMLVVLPGAAVQGGVTEGFGSKATLTWDDLKAIRNDVPSVRYAAALLQTNGQTQADGRNWATSINGTSPAYFDIRDWPIEEGVCFTQSDLTGRAKVAVLGQTVVKKLYGPRVNPVGQVIRINNVSFQIIGVLVPKGQSARGQDNDDAVFIPESTFQSFIQGGLQEFIQGAIFIGATSKDTTDRAERQVTALLRQRHHIQGGRADDFSLRNLNDIAQTVTAATTALTMLLAAVAAVSLLVGGIGIMNIMLVSVTERTREIGLRMAVGAKTTNILSQFLAESLVLSVAGGIIGIVLGVVTTQLIAHRLGWPVPVRPAVIVIAVAFSALAGVGFGLYPARKASLLDPIEALRYE
ncbi:MAG: ABC transporter permease [Silvibacterium sp.]